METKKIYFDLDCCESGNQFTADGVYQGDVETTEFVIRILYSGTDISTEDCHIRIYGRKPDGTNICNQCWTDDDGEVHYILHQQDTAVSGIVEYQVVISKKVGEDIKVLATPSFSCYVAEKVVSQNYQLVKSKPLNWEKNYYYYFKRNQWGYIPVTSVNDWADGEIYISFGFVESSDEIDVLTNLIHKVENLATGQGVVDNVEINPQGELVLKYSNGEEKSLGVVKGLDGIDCHHTFEGTVLTLTSASGTTSVDLKGENGKDYILTQQDKTEIADMVMGMLPMGDEVAY